MTRSTTISFAIDWSIAIDALGTPGPPGGIWGDHDVQPLQLYIWATISHIAYSTETTGGYVHKLIHTCSLVPGHAD